MDTRAKIKYNSGIMITRRKDMEQVSIMLEFTKSIDQENDLDKFYKLIIAKYLKFPEWFLELEFLHELNFIILIFRFYNL